MFLSLGEQPPSNSFLRVDQIGDEESFPLEVYLCKSCCLVQLVDVVPGDVIFDDYVYLASESKALVAHYQGLVDGLSTDCKLQAGDVVVDIGCNDGIMLNRYRTDGVIRVGVEPSSVAAIAMDHGLNVLKTFFGTEAAAEIVQNYGRARVVTATNVYAHVDDMDAFTAGIPELLADDGIFVIEASYLCDLIDQVLFDTIYHEHLCYLSLTPMVPFLGRHGLRVIDVAKIPFGASGPAFRAIIARADGPHVVSESVESFLADERAWGIADLEKYEGYAMQVRTVRTELLKLMNQLRDDGFTLGGYGAPAKGNTLLNYLGVTSRDIEAIAETNVLKQGTVTPGSHVPIISEDEFLARSFDYALLLSWNYLDFFLEKSPYIKQGGRFIVPLPTPRIAPH